MLLSYYQDQQVEAGCDEAGRGCLAGPVFAAAVIFPADYHHELLNDSKKLSEKKRMALRPIIEREALAYAVASVSAEEIDRINIHNASYLAMHKALDRLQIKAEYIIVDGNRFIPYQETPHSCIIKGDGKYLSIAAASILAKTYRDEYMDNIASDYPIIINNLHFLHNIGRKILCRCLNITSKEVFAINSDPFYRLSLRSDIAVFIDFNAL